MTAESIAVLLNAGGFFLALVLYSMLLGLVWRDRHRRAAGGTQGSDSLPLVTGTLGVAWNLGAFLAHQHQAGTTPEHAHVVLAVVSYTALGFLPAVFVHSHLRAGASSRAGAAVRRGAYALSGAALMLHAASAVTGRVAPSPAALGLLGGGFLTTGLVLALWRGSGVRLADRVVCAVALAAFAFSALHMVTHQAGQDTWSSAFFGHHASIPLALAILYQDYRFALADLFLKRALSLLLVAGLCLALFLAGTGGAPRFFTERDPAGAVLLLALWVGVAVIYGRLGRAVNWFVDRIILRRPDYAEVRAVVARDLEQADSPEQALDLAARRLGAALGTAPISVRTASESWALLPDVVSVDDRGAGASVLVPTTEDPRYLLDIPPMAGGRRLLSEEMALLRTAALLLARLIDALRLTRERFERQLREEEIARLSLEAELRALHAQLNPHFLFNALNTLAYLMRRAPDHGLSTLQQLTSVLRKVLRRREGEKVTLADELELVESYLAIETARFEERLSTRVDVSEELRHALVPPLVLQPLVENAIRHGVAPAREGGRVVVSARVEGRPASLVLTVANTGAAGGGEGHGLGLSNLEKRLRAHYGEVGTVRLDHGAAGGAIATVRLPYETRPAAEKAAS